MIDSRAIIDPSAKIAEGVHIGPFSIIGADVEIGEGTVVGPHVIIRGPTKIGKHNRFFQFSSIGEECQDKKYAGEPTTLSIGDHNVFREACTIHRGTIQDQGHTQIGSHNLFMVNVHVAHDCVVGDHVIVANDSNLAGHVHVGDWAILGGSTQVHQFCHIGAHAMTGAGTVLFKDIPAYVMASGHPAQPHGINSEGLRRRGFSSDGIMAIKRAYKTVYRQGRTREEALLALADASQDEAIAVFIRSVETSQRGIIR